MLMYLLCRGVLPRLFVLLSTQALWSYVFIRQKERLEAYDDGNLPECFFKKPSELVNAVMVDEVARHGRYYVSLFKDAETGGCFSTPTAAARQLRKNSVIGVGIYSTLSYA